MPKITEFSPVLEDIEQDLKQKVPNLTISPLETNLLADLVLFTAEEKNYPYCGSYKATKLHVTDQTAIVFSFAHLSDDQANQICENLNKKRGADVAFHSGSTCRIYDSSQITITTDALKAVIATEMEGFILANPGRFDDYHYSFDSLIEKINAILASYGLHEEDFILGETICRLGYDSVEDSVKRLSALYEGDTEAILADIKTIIHGYVTSVPAESLLGENTLPQFSFIYPAESDTQAILRLSLPVTKAKIMVNYFNNILPNSAMIKAADANLLDEDEEETKDDTTYIVIDNRALHHPDFILDFKSKVASYDAQTLNFYRISSDYLVKELLAISKNIKRNMNELKFGNYLDRNDKVLKISSELDNELLNAAKKSRPYAFLCDENYWNRIGQLKSDFETELTKWVATFPKTPNMNATFLAPNTVTGLFFMKKNSGQAFNLFIQQRESCHGAYARIQGCLLRMDEARLGALNNNQPEQRLMCR